jgi:hypothetical protein
MGQYHWPVNLDRHEFIHPHAFGDGPSCLSSDAAAMAP